SFRRQALRTPGKRLKAAAIGRSLLYWSAGTSTARRATTALALPPGPVLGLGGHEPAAGERGLRARAVRAGAPRPARSRSPCRAAPRTGLSCRSPSPWHPLGRSPQTHQAYHRDEPAAFSSPARSEELWVLRVRQCWCTPACRP